MDKELGRALVKAIKCPPGVHFAQLEGNTMVFQKSQDESLYYDIISLAHADENDKVRRKVVDQMEDVPTVIRENFQIQTYEKATGRIASGKHIVTLTRLTTKRP